MPAEKTKDPTPRELVPPYPRHTYFQDGDGTQLTVGGARHAFKHDAGGFELVNAWWLAEAATLVYDREDFVRERFSNAGLPKVVLIDRAGTQCYVASNNQFSVIAFRGTESGARNLEEIRQIVIDVRDDGHFLPTPFGAGGKVHRGFAAAVNAVWDVAGGLRSHLAAVGGGRSFWFTGHSLGAASATVAALLAEQSGMHVSGLYTYGSPRVGNAEFATQFPGVFPGNSGRDYHRFVNERDIVTRVPPEQFGFRHVGSAHHIEPDGTIKAGELKGDATPAETGALQGLLGRLADLARKINVPGLGGFKLPAGRLPPALEKEIDKLIEKLPHDRIDAELLGRAPDFLKHHVPTMYSNRIWNEYIKTLP
jgi:triacylglycerol lipase